MDKAQLRQQFLARRRSLPLTEWQQLSYQVCHQLRCLPQFQQANTIAAYFTTQQEPDLSPLFTPAKTWGFPRCVGQQLQWSTWQPGQPLLPGKYGIPMPPLEAPLLDPAHIDLLLIPAVAGDRQGYRLGYGGGFYDRLLANPAWQPLPRLGIVFSFAMVETLPHDPWDLPLDGFCTEIGAERSKSVVRP